MNFETTGAKRAGSRLVDLLCGYGVEHVFGIPGTHNIELYRGLATSPIRHILTRHEQGAAMAADGYARVTGKPGVCFLITGPGVGNAVSAIGQAYSDSVPMLVISSACARPTLGKGLGFLHECRDQTQLTAAVTAWSVMAQTADDIAFYIHKAFADFAQSRPRPVHISIPFDLLAEEVGPEVGQAWAPRMPAHLPAPAPALIAQAAQLLGQAAKPLILIGGGAVGAASQIRALAEHTGALVASSVAGKGIVPDDHPQYVGSFLCLQQGWALARAADLVLAIGTELAETDHWRAALPLGAPVIRIDIDPAKMGDAYPAAVALLGDAAPATAALLAALPATMDGPPRAPWPPPFTQADMRAALAPLQQTHAAIWDTIEAACPAETTITCDMTQLGYSGNYLMPRHTARRYLHPIGFGTLGYALPAGIGAALGGAALAGGGLGGGGLGGAPVLAVIGDAGLLFTLPELATAVEEVHTSLVVLVWNNAALGEIRQNLLDADIAPIAVTPRNPDFIALAKAFGCMTARPASLAELHTALAQGFAQSGVTLIELTPEAAI